VGLSDAPPAAPVSQTPVIGPTSAARLARALGTYAETEADGTQSVSFPAPGAPSGAGVPDYVPFSTAPVTVSSAPTGATLSRVEDEPPSSSSSSSTASSSAAPPPSPAPPAPAAGVDVDEIADTVIDKLRREMLIERELGGGAMDLI
jgi:hypothetical protein